MFNRGVIRFRSGFLVLCVIAFAFVFLAGCKEDKKPRKISYEVYKEYPDGTVTKWSVNGPVSTGDGFVWWDKSEKEKIILSGSLSIVKHSEEIEIPAKKVVDEKEQPAEKGKEQDEKK